MEGRVQKLRGIKCICSQNKLLFEMFRFCEYIVTFVYSWEGSETFQRYSKRYKKLKINKRQQEINFDV